MDRACDRCGGAFTAAHRRARFCSPKCRTQATRARARGESEALPPRTKAKGSSRQKASTADATEVTGVTSAVIAELTAAGRLHTSAGQSALALARRIDDGAESSAGLAALTREMRAAMAEATSNVAEAGDALDELRARREARRAG